MNFVSISIIFGLLSFGQLNNCGADPIATASNTLNAVVCGDGSWSFLYNVDKCIKLIPQLANFYEATRLCRDLIGISDSETDKNPIPLITIKSEEEQEAIVKLLFDQWKIPGDVWLGAVQLAEENKFVWPDNSPLEYSNWAPDLPSFQNNCSQISSNVYPLNQQQQRKGDEINHPNLHKNQRQEYLPGLWKDENCESKQNYVLCQKPGDWRFIQIQKALDTLSKAGASEELKALQLNQNSMQKMLDNLLDHQKNLQREVNTLKSDYKKCQNQLENNFLPTFKSLGKNFSDLQSKFDILQFEYNYLLTNPVPIGFVYFQLPNTEEPSHLWPMVSWIEITSDYKNLFFRAEGDKSGLFGTIQNEQLRNDHGRTMGSLVSPPSSFMLPASSPLFPIPLNVPVFNRLNYFYTTPVYTHEIRPMNTAIRIWTRVA